VKLAKPLKNHLKRKDAENAICNPNVQADWIIPNRRPPDEWPYSGKIVMEEFDLKYREGLPLVLKQITCDIRPGEKVHR